MQTWQSQWPHLTIFVIATMVLFTGCDTGTYGKRYAEREEQLRADSTMAGHLRPGAATELNDAANNATGIVVRHPSIFAAGEGYFDLRSLANEPKRAVPPGISIPGFTFSQERFGRAADNTNVGYYVYHGVVPASQSTQEEVKQSILNAIAAVFPDSKANFKSVTYPVIGGDQIEWEELKILAGQEFAYFLPNDTEILYRQMDGHLLFCIHSFSDYHVIMAWRVPAEIADSLEFIQAAEASMGTIRQVSAS